MDGDAEIAPNEDINLDLNLNTNVLVIEDVLTYLPENLQKTLSSVEYSGKLTITEAEVKGIINDSLMPLISAKVLTDNVKVNVPTLPYPFSNINLDANLNLDLKGKANSVIINSMRAKFNRSDLNVTGVVDDLLGDVALKLS